LKADELERNQHVATGPQFSYKRGPAVSMPFLI